MLVSEGKEKRLDCSDRKAKGLRSAVVINETALSSLTRTSPDHFVVHMKCSPSWLDSHASSLSLSLSLPPSLSVVTTPAFARSQAPKMMIEGADIAISNVASNANLIATSVSDNGGYLFPVVGIGFLAAIILFLAPPLLDE